MRGTASGSRANGNLTGGAKRPLDMGLKDPGRPREALGRGEEKQGEGGGVTRPQSGSHAASRSRACTPQQAVQETKRSRG